MIKHRTLMVLTTVLSLAVSVSAMVTSHGLAEALQEVQRDGNTARMHEEKEEYVPGEVLVLLSADADRNGIIEAEEGFAGADAAVDGEIERRVALSRRQQVLLVKLPTGKEVETAIAENWGGRDRRILAVEPNYRVNIARTPNDPNFAQLWGMHNTGQTGGIEDADIDAAEAWDVATGVPDGKDVIVAVIDTGIDYLHADLADNMWVNPGEIAGNNIDDDGNGYIDDVYGYDFYHNDSDPSDTYGHGTHCAGTIAGIGDNGIGVAGVNWRCKLMAVRFLGAGGSGNIFDAVEAINYAVANGAKILSNSWGGGGYSASMEAAIINAKDKGVLVVAAAGNSSSDTDAYSFYPASYAVSNVISVAATDHNDALASFSSYGTKSVHVGAPGVYILSCFPKYKDLFFEDFQDAVTPGFEGTEMILEGSVNRWGTIKPEVPPPLPPGPPPPPPDSLPGQKGDVFAAALDPNNIVACGDWANSRPYLGGSSGSIVTPPIDTRDVRGLVAEFAFRFEGGEDDALSVDVWDGASWQTIFSQSNKRYYNENFYYWVRFDILESYRNEEMRVRFHWSSNISDNDYFGVEIDNISIQCIEDHNEHYVYYQGTSMATPHVSGVAALVMANLPGPASPETTIGGTSDNDGISLDELKARIVWTGDSIPTLEGKTISGRRLNAYNALTAPPGPTVITPNGGENWGLGATQTIRWYSIGGGEVVDIYLHKGGEVYAQIAEDISNNGEFAWTIPISLPTDSDYQIEITDGTHLDVSDEDFEMFCRILEPNSPDPCDGSSDVVVDANLSWNFGVLEPVTITFDEVAKDTTVDSMVIGDVSFFFYGDDAIVTDTGPGYTEYIQKPNIEGSSNGILMLDFAIPVFGISYGFAMDSIYSQPTATTMVLFDSSYAVIESFSADAMDTGHLVIEGLNSGTSTRAIAHVFMTFYHPYASRFALDNLTYSPIPGWLPEGTTGGVYGTESGEYRGANGADSGFKGWFKPEEGDLVQAKYLLPSVGGSVESGAKEPSATESISMAGNISEQDGCGSDAGDYIFIDSDEPNGPSFDWIEIATESPGLSPPADVAEPVQGESTETVTGTNLGLSDDSWFFPIELPFSFSFYGKKYRHVAAGSNGTVYFSNLYMDNANCCIPCDTPGIERFIAVYWDDLNPTPGGDDNVYYAIVGEPPNRILVVQWQNIKHYDSQDSVTCQLQLFEGSNDILLLYAEPSSEFGGGATIGVQRNRNCGLNYLCNKPNLHSGLAVLFRYEQSCPTTWDVYFGTDPNTLELIESDLTKPICDPTPGPGEILRRGMRYYWHVVVKNCCGAVDGNDWSFTTENTPPVADAGDEKIIECACNTGEGTQVRLDGTRSGDADGTALTYRWTGPFVGSPARGATPTVILDSGCPGDYIISLVVNDGIEDSEPNEVVITVEDTRPPGFELSVNPAILWPPNHKMVEITPSWTVSDECDATPEVSLVGIVMKEGDDIISDVNTTDDIQIGEDGSIYLRAERSGTSDDRIYTITYQAVDESGNASVGSATVSIPHDFQLLARIAARWLWSSPAGRIPEDLNGDGIVNLADFALFAENWIK